MNDNTIKPTIAGLDLYSSIDVDIEVGSVKKVKVLKDTERNNKGFGEMDKIFKYFDMYNYKTQ